MIRLFSFLILFSCLSFAQVKDSANTFLSKGGSAYQKFNNESALNFYEKAFFLDNNKNYEVAWKISRAYVDIGEVKEDKNERKMYYQKGSDYADKAIEINPDGSKGYLFSSIALGRVALDAGKKEQVRLSKEIKKQVDKSLELNPNDDIAWHVLGRWNRKMATLGWIQRQFANVFLGGVPKDASVEESANCFKKAIELNPGHINHHLELAYTYEELNEKELAKQEYQKVLDLPEKDSDDKDHKLNAEKRLKKLM